MPEIQLGNKILDTSLHGQTMTAQVISTAAQNLRTALNAAGFGIDGLCGVSCRVIGRSGIGYPRLWGSHWARRDI